MTSFVSPIARLLMGKSVGEGITMAGQEIEVVAIT
jgi:transcription elongation GreA/GreB family factor